MYEEIEHQKTTKVCARCKQEKPLSEFGVKKRTKDGLNPYCKDCIREYTKELKNKKKERIEQLELVEKEGIKNLANYTPRQLIEELSRRGYRGKLRYTYEIDLEKL